MSMFNSTMPCLFCDKKLLIDAQGWTEHHVAVCLQCLETSTLGMMRMMLFLRRQIAGLGVEVFNSSQSIQRLFTAQQELVTSLDNGE